ncbi:MAG: hypothetical protein ACKVOP_01980 [Sphingomonadaceae bacterium]
MREEMPLWSSHVNEEGCPSPMLYAGAALAFLIAGFAVVMERRQLDRRDRDRISPVSWPFVMLSSLLAATVMAALAIHSG